MNNPDSRVGDAERNQAIDELSRYLTQGALDSYEYDLRTSEAAAAQTRAEIDQVFADLPSLDRGSDDESTFNPTEAEVADMKERRKKVKVVDYAAWAATILSIVLGYFVFHWSYFWVIPIICMVCSARARFVYDLSYHEEEYLMFERRFERRRRRASDKRRRELGQ